MYPEDMPQELFYDAIYKDFTENVLEDWEVYERIVDDFKEGRMTEYYLKHTGIIEGPKGMLEEAKNLLTSNLRASLVLGYAAGEVGLIKGILAPILHGCFHNESAANLLVNAIVKTKNEKLSKALFTILTNSTEIDLKIFCRSGSEKPLSQEISEIQKIRNEVLHHAGTVAEGEASLAITTSETILNEIFNAVLKKLGLHLHEGNLVCGSPSCQSSQKNS